MTLAKALWIIVIATGCTGRSRVAAQEGPPPASEEAAETRVINLTDAAVRALVELLGPGELRREDHPLRVSVEGTAATGYSYYFGFADDPNEPQYKVDEARDYIQVVKGFPIAVRREHVRYLKGITIDYVESPTEGAGFKFENPGGTLEAIIAREQQ